MQIIKEEGELEEAKKIQDGMLPKEFPSSKSLMFPLD